MIVIEERLANKLPILTSLFFKLNFYDKQVIDQINGLDICFYDKITGEYEIPTTRLFFITNLLIKYDNIKFKFYNEEEKSKISCNNYIKDFKLKPYGYQVDGINYGLNHDGWLLLDDQGLGKTLQMIYLSEVLKKRDSVNHCLVICGVSSLKFNWALEIEKLSKLSYRILGLRTRKNGSQYIASVEERCAELQDKIDEFFVITNIETLQNKKFVQAFKKSKNKFDIIVLDEAHRVKNPAAKATGNLLKLDAKRKIALTGTLIMNSPDNAYIALKWTGNTNCTHSMFCKMYNVYGGYAGVQVVGYKNLDLLQELINSCSLRRKKEDVLDLPEKTYITEYVEMGPRQSDLYNEVNHGIVEELNLLSKRKKISIMDELVLNMRLRQITAYPGILSTTVTESAKLDRLEELIEDIVNQGDKAIVYCTFKSTVPEVEKRLKKYNPLVCSGDVNDIIISNNKRLFENNPDNKVLVCTWQKMGTGHTLTAANYVIFIDTPWTNSDFEQAADRAYRNGQNKHTFIITLICKGTYDERVKEILDRKEILSSYVIDDVDKGLKQCSDYDSIS